MSQVLYWGPTSIWRHLTATLRIVVIRHRPNTLNLNDGTLQAITSSRRTRHINLNTSKSYGTIKRKGKNPKFKTWERVSRRFF